MKRGAPLPARSASHSRTSCNSSSLHWLSRCQISPCNEPSWLAGGISVCSGRSSAAATCAKRVIEIFPSPRLKLRNKPWREFRALSQFLDRQPRPSPERPHLRPDACEQ